MYLFRLVLLSMFLALAFGCQERKSASPPAPPQLVPSLYLLNHKEWTPVLVLNFAQEVAPLDEVGKAPSQRPEISPYSEGDWTWQDPSRLVFVPKNRTFAPGTRLTITVEGLKLRDGASLKRSPLQYQTPPLALLRQDCHWLDILQAPMRRQFEAVVEFNYPLHYPAFAATLGQTPLPISSASGSRLTLRSEPLLRPAQDGGLGFKLNPGVLRVQDRDARAASRPGAEAPLAQGVDCQLPVQRSAWDKIDEPKPAVPTVTGLSASLNNGKLEIRLQGRDLIESAKKTQAGAEVKTGATIIPAVEGRWTYGESAQGADLVFIPARPEAFKPGTAYDIAVAAAAFPPLTFERPSFTVKAAQQAMAGQIQSLELHSDPAEPRSKRIAATLSFNYPPDRDSLRAKASVRLRVEPVKHFDDSGVRQLAYELTYDEKNPLLAYLKTAPISIPDEPGEVYVRIDGGFSSTLGGEPAAGFGKTLRIPATSEFLQFSGAEAQSVIKNDGDIERLLILNTTTPLQDPQSLAKSVQAYLLPDCHEENPERPPLCEEKDLAEWDSADQIDAAALQQSTLVPLAWRDGDESAPTTHYLTFQGPEKRQLFVKVNKGIISTEGFSLAKDARFLLNLGENRRELKILHEGALLSLTGSKKLGVAARGMDKVDVVLRRILPHNMHHFAQFTRGDFQNPSFKIPVEHFAEKFSYEETLPSGKAMRRQYFAVDFARFMAQKGYPPHGLFVLSVAEKKPSAKTGPAEEAKPCETENADAEGAEAQADCTETQAEAARADDTEGGEAESEESGDSEENQGIQDQRLVLLTDLGLLVKTAADGQQDVFVLSFRSGQPAVGVQVWLLGANGAPLSGAKTDAQGRARLPSVEGLKDEKAPAVYLAEDKNGDMTFLPYARDNRLLDVSRFDTGGLRDKPDSLHAFLFSDRGIYRPGDTAHIGLILRKRDWSALPSGLPLQAVISDPEDQEVAKQTIAFGPAGFAELQWASAEGGKTGSYRVELFLADPAKKNPKEQKTSLGHTTIRVEEFQPDRLQVKTEIIGAPPQGWIKPDAAQAQISVRNLFGTAAVGNPAKLEMTVRPWSGQVPGFPDYRFRGSLGANIPPEPQELGEAATDAQGMARFGLPLAQIAEPIYEITLAGEGFEKGSGRSVVNVAQALVSSQAYLLGQAADGPLDYIGKASPRKLKLLALGPDFKPAGAATVTAEIFAERYVSTLVKREDGLYAYQSVRREESKQTAKITLAAGQAEFALPTDTPGRFFAVFKTAQGQELNRVAYSVAGEGNISRNIERNAELSLTLNKPEYRPGETIEVQIVAPYTGAGLLTIEQDGVLASQWFKTQSTASTQRITLPSNVSGNAYVSVAFVRALDSPEIYMSPLSAAVAPITISRQAFVNEISLNVPDKVQPGGHLEVRYSVKQACKLVLYAVDEGILQFAHYHNPAPLDFFFRKRALQTKTHQILDLLLPDYALVQKLAGAGGDEDAEIFGKYKNPFARKHKPPMAFWSGIIDAEPGEQVLSLPVPDYFNGSVRVIAVAVNPGQIAAPVAKTVASNPYVIQPQQPYAVAPGDQFELGVLVANNTGEAGDKTLEVSIEPSPALKLLSANPQQITLGPGRDGTVRFKAQAEAKLGPAKVVYRATGAGREASYSEDMSIRPAQPLLTTLQNGVLRITDQQAGQTAKLEQTRQTYAEQRLAEFTVSATPTAYLRGVAEFLKHYPYGCTEQITSQAFPAVVLGANEELGLSAQDAERLLGRALKILQTRQKHDGSFGVWSVADAVNPFYSMYAAHLLLEARERGLKISEAMFEKALAYADQYTQERHYDWEQHQAQAYALYLLARNGKNLTERLKAFEAELQRQWGQGGNAANWTRLFLGAAFKLHHLDADADRYFGEFQRRWKTTGQMPWNLQNSPEAMSLYLYLLNKHFPELLDTQDPAFARYLLELGQDLVKQRTYSFQGAWSLLGMGSLWSRFEQAEGKNYAVSVGQPPKPLELLGRTVKRALLDKAASPVNIRGDGLFNLYYQLTERGYDQAPPPAAINQGITVTRALLDDKGGKLDSLTLQDKLHIRLGLHPDKAMKDLAVTMLIPGGFEIDLSEDGLGSRQSLPIKNQPLWQPDYIDVQEDRVIFFGKLDGGEQYFEFRLKPLNVGHYTVPPVLAEGMYDTGILHRGLADSINVTE